MKMFIDDERSPQFLEHFGFTRAEYVDMVVVRSSKDAIQHMIDHGMPIFISFDFDLGGDDTSKTVVKWIIEAVLNKSVTISPEFDWFVHSQNPIGRDWLIGAMNDVVRLAKTA